MEKIRGEGGKFRKTRRGGVHKLAGKLWETKWVSGKTGGGRADAPRGCKNDDGGLGHH